MSAGNPKHPYEFYGLKLMDILQQFGTQLADEELRLLAGLTKGQFDLGFEWLEDHNLILKKNPLDPIVIDGPFYLN